MTKYITGLYLEIWILSEKPPVTKLVNFPTLYGAWRSITVFTRAPLLTPIQRHRNPVHPIPAYFLTIHFNIILPPTSRPSWWSLSFWLSHQNPVCIPLRSNACYVPYSTHLPWFHHSNKVWASSLCNFLHPNRHFIPLRSKYSPQHPVLKYLTLYHYWL
jgi:hypothetical protein